MFVPRSSLMFLGVAIGVVGAWACGIADTPSANAQSDGCASYTVSFVRTTIEEGNVASVTIDDGEPFAIALVPGQVPPQIAVRTCAP